MARNVNELMYKCKHWRTFSYWKIVDYGILSFELFIVIWLNYFNILPLLVSINKVWKWAALSFQQRGVFKCCLSQWCPWSKKVENHWSNKHCPIKLNVTLHQKDCNTQCMQKLDCVRNMAHWQYRNRRLFYQVVEGGALLATAHVSEKTIIGYKQQRACVLTVVHRLPSLS